MADENRTVSHLELVKSQYDVKDNHIVQKSGSLKLLTNYSSVVEHPILTWEGAGSNPASLKLGILK